MKRKFTISFVSNATSRDISAWLDLLDGSCEMRMSVEDVAVEKWDWKGRPLEKKPDVAEKKYVVAEKVPGDKPVLVRTLEGRGYRVGQSGTGGWWVEIHGHRYRSSSAALKVFVKHGEVVRLKPSSSLVTNPNHAPQAIIDIPATIKAAGLSPDVLSSKRFRADFGSLEMSLQRANRFATNSSGT